jgi:hypothetical protein
MSLKNRGFLFWKERGRVREREGWAGRQAAIFKVRFVRDRGRDRDRET